MVFHLVQRPGVGTFQKSAVDEAVMFQFLADQHRDSVCRMGIQVLDIQPKAHLFRMLECGKILGQCQAFKGVFDVMADEHLVLAACINEVEFHSVEPLFLGLGGEGVVDVVCPYFALGQEEFPVGELLWLLLLTADES